MAILGRRLTGVTVTLHEITDENRTAVLALNVGPEQERFVGSVRGALEDAAEYPQANPWYRALFVRAAPSAPTPMELPIKVRRI